MDVTPSSSCPWAHLQRGLSEALIEQLHVALLLLQLLLQLGNPSLQPALLVQQR